MDRGYSRVGSVPLDRKRVEKFMEKHGSAYYVDIAGKEGYYDLNGEEQVGFAHKAIKSGLKLTGLDFIQTDFKKEYEDPSGEVNIRDEPAFLVEGEADRNMIMEEVEKAVRTCPRTADRPFGIAVETYDWKG